MFGLKRLILATIFGAGGTLLFGIAAQAQQVVFGDVPGRRQGDIHNPFSPRYLDMQPNGLARREANRPNPPSNGGGGGRGRGRGHHHHHHHGCFPFFPVIGWQSTGTSLFYGNVGWGNGGWWNGYNPYGWTQPIIVDGLSVYNIVQQPIAPPAPAPVDVRRDDPADDEAPRDPRDLSTHRNELAERFIEHGDRMFGEGNYQQAQFRYRKASDIAPTQALPRLRRGQAFLATGRYEQAAEELYLGLQLNPQWIQGGFRVQDLYGAHVADLDEHVRALETAAAARPDDADLTFLLGWMYFVSGRREVAHPLFQKATVIGQRDALLEGLVQASAPAEPVAQHQAPPPQREQRPPARMPGQPAQMPGGPAAPAQPRAGQPPVAQPPVVPPVAQPPAVDGIEI